MSFLRQLHRLGGLLISRANAAVGGQAVMNGVMMRSPHFWSVAVRRSDGTISTEVTEHTSYAARHRLARIPIVRGVVSLGDALVIGLRALNVSTRFAIIDEERAEARKRGPRPVDAEGGAAVADDAKDDGEIPGWQIALMIVVAVAFTIGLFKAMPALVVGHFIHDNQSLRFAVVEGVFRLAVLLGYLGLIGFLPEMRGVFQYHSSEHKAINAWENDVALTPVEVNQQSRIHVRCGTAFLLWVMVVAIVVYAVFGHFVGHLALPWLVLSRVGMLFPIAGIAFELIKFAGKHPHNALLRVLLAPGLWLQRFTTRPCEPEHCEVAIASLGAVLESEYPELSHGQALAQLTSQVTPVDVVA